VSAPASRRSPWFRRHPRAALALGIVGATLVLDFATATALRSAGLVDFDRPDAHYRMSHPVYSHGLRPNVDCTAQWGAARYPMRTDSLGCRDFAPRRLAPVPSGPRVLLIGDSFGEGVGVAYEDCFAGILTQRFAARGIEVVNASAASYSPWVYDAKVRYLVEHEGLVFDHLVVCIDASDIDDEVRRLGAGPDATAPRQNPVVALWRAYVRDHSLLFGSAAVVSRWLRGRADQRRASDWRAALDHPRCRWAIDDEVFAREGARGAEAARQAMDRLVEFVRARGIPMTVVLYPWPDFVARRDGGRYVAMWRQWCADREVPLIDCCPRFFAAGDTPEAVIRRAFIPGDVHLTRAGNDLVAECIEAGLPAEIPALPR